ncbi:MAG: hypothetical protein HY609_02055, partial [Deltaproteobacteria bacterium]|nr:hypothetical protein [Deltaproteobacteria bacterium]
GGVLTYMVAAGSVGRTNHVNQVQAFYVTQAGIEYAVKRVYDQQIETVDPPGISFAGGSFTVVRDGRTLIVTGTVGNAERIYSVDSPTEADCTLIDTTQVNLGQNDTVIQQIHFRKICLVLTTVAQMQFTWVNDNGERLTDIRIENSNVYTNPIGAPSGTLLEIVDYALTNPNIHVMNRAKFDSDMSGKTVTLSFIMGDGSTKTVTFDTED